MKKLLNYSILSISLFILVVVILFKNDNENQTLTTSISNNVKLVDGFSYEIIKIDNCKDPIGNIIWLDSDKAKVEWVSKEHNPNLWTDNNINFDKILNYQNSNIANKTVTIVAGAFTPNWKIVEGLAVDDGKVLTKDNYKSKFKGFVQVSDEGKVSIEYIANQIQAIKLSKAAQENNFDLFQTFQIIHNGSLKDSNGQPYYGDTQGNRKNRYRFLVERKSESKNKIGIVEFSKETKVQEAISLLHSLGKESDYYIKEAVYLDMGAVARSMLVKQNGSVDMINNESDQAYKEDGYTNLLVFYQGIID